MESIQVLILTIGIVGGLGGILGLIKFSALDLRNQINEQETRREAMGNLQREVEALKNKARV